jgi:hypothetical protein
VGQCGAGVAQAVIVVAHHRVLGDVADARDHLVPGQQRQEPQRKVSPPHACCRCDAQEDQVGQQEVLFSMKKLLAALPAAGVVAHLVAEKLQTPLHPGDAQDVAPHLAPKALLCDWKGR